MRQKLITLDPTSWDLAAKKPNFSQWVRDQLRSERNKMKVVRENEWKECVYRCGRGMVLGMVTCLSCRKEEEE